MRVLDSEQMSDLRAWDIESFSFQSSNAWCQTPIRDPEPPSCAELRHVVHDFQEGIEPHEGGGRDLGSLKADGRISSVKMTSDLPSSGLGKACSPQWRPWWTFQRPDSIPAPSSRDAGFMFGSVPQNSWSWLQHRFVRRQLSGTNKKR